MNDAESSSQRCCLEVCVGSLDDARVAAAAGADRLELCAALELGGLTPSIGLAEQVIGESELPVVVMIRPRAAGFAYSESEFRCMRADAARLLDAGAAGIVFGVLDADGRIDAARVADVVSIAGSKETVFHKAFDAIRSMEPAIASLITAGVTRVLTSGGAPTAEEGKTRLRQLVAWSRGRIEIMPGGGVDAANAGRLLAETGGTAVHIGAATSRFDPSTSPAAAAALCDLERLHTGARRAVESDRVAAVRQAIDASVTVR